MLQLVERGVIGLDDDVRRYVPTFPDKGHTITVRHLLTHTSGIRHYNPGETSRKREHYPTVDSAITLFKDDPLRFDPGSRDGYTTYGFTLLQGVIEVASGLPFREYMRRHVWEPAGMIGTDLDVADDPHPARAVGHHRRMGRIRQVPFDDVSFKYAGGGMVSTVVDLVRLCVALSDGRLLGPEMVEAMFTPQVPQHNATAGYGWGTRTGDDTGLLRVWHPGRSYGFESYLLCYPDQGVAAAVLTNEDYSNPWQHPGGAATFFASLYLPDLAVPASEVPTQPLAAAARETAMRGEADALGPLARAYAANPVYRYAEPEAELAAAGYDLLRTGHRAGALAVFRVNAELHPQSTDALVGLGEALMAAADPSAARRTFSRVLELNPDHPWAQRVVESLAAIDGAAAGEPSGRYEVAAIVDAGGRKIEIPMTIDLRRGRNGWTGEMTSESESETLTAVLVSGPHVLPTVPTDDGVLRVHMHIGTGPVTGTWYLGGQRGSLRGERVAP